METGEITFNSLSGWVAREKSITGFFRIKNFEFLGEQMLDRIYYLRVWNNQGSITLDREDRHGPYLPIINGFYDQREFFGTFSKNTVDNINIIPPEIGFEVTFSFREQEKDPRDPQKISRLVIFDSREGPGVTHRLNASSFDFWRAYPRWRVLYFKNLGSLQRTLLYFPHQGSDAIDKYQPIENQEFRDGKIIEQNCKGARYPCFNPIVKNYVLVIELSYENDVLDGGHRNKILGFLAALTIYLILR